MANVRNKERKKEIKKEGEVIASSPERPLKYYVVPSQTVPRPVPKLCTYNGAKEGTDKSNNNAL